MAPRSWIERKILELLAQRGAQPIRWLFKECHCSWRSFRRALEELEREGLVEIERLGGPNSFSRVKLLAKGDPRSLEVGSGLYLIEDLVSLARERLGAPPTPELEMYLARLARRLLRKVGGKKLGGWGKLLDYSEGRGRRWVVPGPLLEEVLRKMVEQARRSLRVA